MNREFIVDIEGDGLLEDITKIHCVSFGWYNDKGEFTVRSTTDYEQMKKFFLNKENTCIGHNFVLYDILAVEKILKIKAKCKIIDTLGISWYLEPTRNEHSIESYAIEYGDHKVEINDWKNLPIKEYIKRCEHDVELQNKLWINQKTHLKEIYKNEKDIQRIIEYISFKLDCVKDQQDLGLSFDSELAKNTLKALLEERENKLIALKKGMPKSPIMGVKKMPVKMYNSKSELSAIGKKWVDFLKEQGLPITHVRDVEFIKGYEKPNPGSHVQVKNWLFSLGWKPEHFKFNRNKKTGAISQVPQIGSKEKDGTLCPSVLRLIEKAPALNELNGLTIINHRITVFEGMLRDEVNGRLYQNMGGLTNTLRLQHRILVNLPKPSVPYGKEIRGCLRADEGYVLCGADLSGLEDRTKQHYMYKFDPTYVNEMRTKGWDPHLDIAVRANMMTVEEAKLFKELDKKDSLTSEEVLIYAKLKNVRHKAKTTNYAATYGAGAKKIAVTAEIPLVEGETLHGTYWDRNRAIKQIVEETVTQNIRNQQWLYNPVSKFWYSLRYEKDKFSTLNQSTGSYIFDMWVAYCRGLGLRIAYQSHDEILFNVKINDKEKVFDIIHEAIVKVNNLLKLNVEIACDIKYGQSYKDVH